MNELDLFAAAIAITEPAERSALLERECAGRPELRRRLDQLLEAHFRPEPMLDRPGLDPAGDDSATEIGDRPRGNEPVTDATLDRTGLDQAHDHSATGIVIRATRGKDERVGAVIAGKYTLVEVVGEGGMGSVWRAKQTEPVKRFVAVKLIKAGMDSRQVLARFDAERQALALMDHPNIAKVLDGGLHDGRPYFVMELVKGVPITEYCDARRLTPKQRLELFVPVCQAIQHAHQKGVIHRDIKPSNVLIALYDDRPVVKVIDFGVAKATGGALTEHTIDTGFGGVVGTPQYMSPEQATFNNLDVDTRSDVYALGVLLYELLTGSPPFSKGDLEKRGVLEVLRVVREEEPPRPSTRLSTADALPTLSANRGTDPRSLTGLLRNELDWVVMKALEKDRSRRYETANGFAADVQRYLNGDPVQAHPPSTGYRLRKFVRRNRGQVIAASLVLVTLLGGIVGTTLGLIAANHSAKAERQAKLRESLRAEGEKAAKLDAQQKELLAVAAAAKERAARQEEERQRKFAEAIRRFVQYDFLALTSVDGQDRFGGEGKAALDKNTTLGQLLDRAADKLRARKDLDPRTEAELCRIVGARYREAGDASKGLDLLERAVKLRTDLLGRDHDDTLNAMSSLAVAYGNAGKLDLALPLMEETLRLTRARPAPGQYYIVANMSQAYARSGRLDLALPLMEEAFRLAKAELGPEHRDTLKAMSCLAVTYYEAGKLDRAVPFLEETLKLTKAKLGPEHPSTVGDRNTLALAYQDAGQLDRALPLFEEALRIGRTKYGDDHPVALTSMHNLARAYQAAKQPDRALPLFEETLKLRQAKIGRDHPDTLKTMDAVGLAYQAAGKVDLAMSVLEDALRRANATLGPDHPATFNTMHNLGLAYQAARKFDLAVPLFEELLRRKKARLGPEHPDTLRTMHSLARAYKDLGKLDRAVPLYEDALRLMKATDHPYIPLTMNNLAVAYSAARRFDRSIPLLEESLRLREAKLGRDHSDTLDTLKNLADAYQGAGRLPESIPPLERIRESEIARLGLDHPDTVRTLNGLAVAYWATQQLDKSVPLFEELLRRQEGKLGRGHLETQATVANLGVNYKDAGRLKEAIPLLEEAHRSARENPSLGWVRTQLLHAYVKAGEEAKFRGLMTDELAEIRKTQPEGSAQRAGQLAPIGLFLIQLKQWAEAEPILREVLAIREQAEPDAWSTFSTRSLLGGALRGQKKYTEAEPLLLAGYEGMKQREAAIPEPGKARLPQALDQLIELYTAMDKPDEVKKWQAERAKYLEARPEGEK